MIEKRFNFAAWMFSQAGFDEEQSQIRGRMMVVYMVGEVTLYDDAISSRLDMIRKKHAILVARP